MVAAAPPPGPRGVDLRALHRYLREALGVEAEVAVTLIEGGRSNLTYLVRGPDIDWVLRRPPLGHVLATAHDMGREHRFISALHGVVPVPTPVAHCEDPSVLGAPFYLMERVEGVVLRNAQDVATVTTDQAQAAARAMVDTLVQLHQVEPRSMGLADVGRPDGYVTRQVARWSEQWARSTTRPRGAFEELAERLAAAVPEAGASSIVHGDYRLDNLIISPDLTQVAAVLDWEMATLGDPLTDLGLLVAYWDPVVEPLVGQTHQTLAGTLPDAAWLSERYLTASGSTGAHLAFHIALAYLKLAAIAEGIHARYRAGLTVGEGFEQVGAAVEPLLAAGLDRSASLSI